ncbi:MAG TPA: sensor histidine kinase [Longimicrobiales bacterium]
MRLYEFILANREPILNEWEAFAREASPASATMDVQALRDHAGEMLTVIAKDLETSQGRHDQAEKSKGRIDSTAGDSTAAEEHGAARARSGFTVPQMVAEYRALRASVLRLWAPHQGVLKAAEIEDMIRFNEAIDQSLAESLAEFGMSVEQAKEMFLAILGHDLRTPIGAIYTSATFMLETGEFKEPHLSLLTRISQSATRSMHLVGDLLDFTRSRLGSGIPLSRSRANMGKIVHDVVDEISALHPDKAVEVQTREAEEGNWDVARLSQALTNVIGNAVEHSTAGTPVNIEVHGDDGNVAIAVHNYGVAIDPTDLDGIFNPLTKKTQVQPGGTAPTDNLGLGLYIAERIIAAHDGRISVESSPAKGTTFTIHLPRHDNAAPAKAAD